METRWTSPGLKGRVAGTTTVRVTRNEILTVQTNPAEFILTIAEIDGAAKQPRYVRQPFQREPDFGVESAKDRLYEFLVRGDPLT